MPEQNFLGWHAWATIHMGVILRAHPVRGVPRTQHHAKRKVARRYNFSGGWLRNLLQGFLSLTGLNVKKIIYCQKE